MGYVIDLRILGIQGSRDLEDLRIYEIQAKRRFYIRLARLLLDRSFVLNSNSIFTLY